MKFFELSNNMVQGGRQRVCREEGENEFVGRVPKYIEDRSFFASSIGTYTGIYVHTNLQVLRVCKIPYTI